MRRNGIFVTSIGVVTAFTMLAGAVPAYAQITGNGTLVYESENESTFDPGGATYSRIICLKNNGENNGKLLCTYDQLIKKNVMLSDGTEVSKQVYPIYRSSDNGESWELLADVFDDEYGLPRTSQPCLYELPQDVGELRKGTILLAGNIFDDEPATTSRIVIYKSEDCGESWEFLSEVDNGGPCTYDPSTKSTTTTVWEPFLGLDAYGDLVCYYSDERQKSDGVLQAVSFKTSTDGVNWENFGNVAAITNRKDRPGMITVTSLPNGKYMATYEVVNRPSIKNNNAVVYCKFSDDGINWDAGSLGNRIHLADGRGIGSSPYVKWVNAGGPNGMVIVSAKWGTDKNDNISGGQNFYVNYNLGEGTWERLPFAVTYDPADTKGGYFSGFSQSFDISEDGKQIYQATNVENFSNVKNLDGKNYNLNDVRVGTIPANGTIYEAEKAELRNCRTGENVDASNGKEVQYINESDSSVEFKNIKVSKAGEYTINVRYSNGETNEASHKVYKNGAEVGTINYPVTRDWDRYMWSSFNTYLEKGINTLKFGKNVGFAEIDCIEVSETENSFVVQNRNSNKYLEIVSASTKKNDGAGQWGITDNWCQKWSFENVGDGYYRIKNMNSGLYLSIPNSDNSNGARAVQISKNNSAHQLWRLEETDDGYFHVVNKGSGKFLEVQNNSVEDGAVVGQWDDTGYGCQEWKLLKEGIN